MNDRFNDSYLKLNGIDAHEVKADYDCAPVSHYDIYNGDTVTIRDKDGNLYADTEMTQEEFFDYYSNDRYDENSNEERIISIIDPDHPFDSKAERRGLIVRVVKEYCENV